MRRRAREAIEITFFDGLAPGMRVTSDATAPAIFNTAAHIHFPFIYKDFDGICEK